MGRLHQTGRGQTLKIAAVAALIVITGVERTGLTDGIRWQRFERAETGVTVFDERTLTRFRSMRRRGRTRKTLGKKKFQRLLKKFHVVLLQRSENRRFYVFVTNINTGATLVNEITCLISSVCLILVDKRQQNRNRSRSRRTITY